MISENAGLIIAIAGLIVTISVAAYAHYATKTREIEARHFQDKRKAYMGFVDLFYDLAKEPAISEDELMTRMLQMKKSILIWASPGMVEAWNAFEDGLAAGDPAVFPDILDDILRAVRKELGHDDSSSRAGPS